MNIERKNNSWIKNTDWAFLLFLVGAVNVKLYIKVFAVAAYLIYTWYKKYSRPKFNDINKFYLLLPVAGTIGSLLHGSFGVNTYLPGYTLGIAQWVTALLISYAAYLTLANKRDESLINAVKVFFVLNMCVSVGELLLMVVQSGHFPYWYWEPTEYYGTSTGDHIRGLFRSNSITNAMACTLGVIYYLYHNQLKLSVLCLIVVLLCTSNLTLALLLLSVVLLLVFVNKKAVRKQTLLVMVLTIIIYPVLTPLNLQYVANTFDKQVEEAKIAKLQEKKPDSVIIRKDNVSVAIPKAYETKRDYFLVKTNKEVYINYAEELGHLKYFGTLNMDSNSNIVLKQHAIKDAMTRWYGVAPQYSPLSSYHKPAKIYTHRQTQYYLLDDWKNAAFGAGIGNFSSKLAIKMTALGLSGGYPEDYRYISPDYLSGHFYAIMYVLAKPVGEHSTIQMPNSVYNQLAGEYGLAGVGLFVYFYLGFFWRNRKYAGAGKYLVLITLLFFAFEYWFEMMSLTVVFELLVLLDIYKKKEIDRASVGDRADAGV